MAKNPKSVETLTHQEATRKNIPTAEYQPMVDEETREPIAVAFERRNRDLDPQLVWRGKDMKDWSDLVVQAPPLYIQEKVHPKVLIDDLVACDQWLVASGKSRGNAGDSTQGTSHEPQATQLDLFADFNVIPEGVDKTDFYQHDAHWSNRMILGDSLQVMASLAEREGLRGKVQCIYLDPPYGIKFNSNFQWSTTSRDVKDGKADHITREPEQVKAFRDTWRDGIHSYLTYLRDRLTVARDLLTESGSIFVQIGDENVHRVRALMDEVFGDDNAGPIILVKKKGGQKGGKLEEVNDYILLYYRSKSVGKFKQLFDSYQDESELSSNYGLVHLSTGEWSSVARECKRDDVGELYKLKPSLLEEKGHRLFKSENSTSGGERKNQSSIFRFRGRDFDPGISKGSCWKHTAISPIGVFSGMDRMAVADRLYIGRDQIGFVRYKDDFGKQPISNWWDGFGGAPDQFYVVQTNERVIQRCLLMATDPGDLVLDPTCGSGTTAYVAEQWGRRWVTIDTSRVALALARARIMGARYPFYLLKDSKEGQQKEAEVTRTARSTAPTYGEIRHGFVYDRVPHITSSVIANNAEIDVIWDKHQPRVQSALAALNTALRGHEKPFIPETGGRQGWKIDFTLATSHEPQATHTMPSGEEVPANELQEWEVPREPPEHWPQATQPLITDFWDARIARQKEIDASIAARADHEFLYDKPYDDKKKVRVAGPFTVESISPHRVLGVDEDDELIDTVREDPAAGFGEKQSFPQMILENLRTAGVQQAHKADKLTFTSLQPWPGKHVHAEGRYSEGDKEKRAAVFIGPEFGTVTRPDLVEAARESADAGFDVLVACAFSYAAHTTEFNKLGNVPVLKARMNADLHMADDLKNTGKGNLFLIFGEPDIEVACDLWLVTSSGRMVANYEHVKELSGVGSLEEINRLGREDLSRFKRFSAGRKVRPDESTAQVSGIGSQQRGGGSGENGNRGISPESQRGDGIIGRSGDATDNSASAGLPDGSAGENAAGHGGGEQSHARGAQEVSGNPKGNQLLATSHKALATLSDADFPLQLSSQPFGQIMVRGVDVFKPQTGEVISDGPDGIACWFIDTDYNQESFFVRHAYFLGANDPYKALKTTLKAEIDQDAWQTLNSDTSRPFPKPKDGRIAVKVINHLGDEVMKVFRISDL